MTTQVPYSVLLVWLVGPALLLTIFGIAPFRRYRTLPSALVALGPLWILARLCSPLGMWMASLSLLWHMFSTRGVASSDDR